MSNDASILTLRTLLGDYPNTKALKTGDSSLVQRRTRFRRRESAEYSL